MRAIAIGGEPGSGKTTIMTDLLKILKPKKKLYEKILNYEESLDGRVFVFGKYSGNKYDGTDAISMAVQPIAEKFFKKKRKKDVIILFEGDRLFNQKFLNFIPKLCPLTIIILSTADHIKQKRYKDRNDDRNKVFLKSKKTKTKNIFMAFPNAIILNSETHQDKRENIAFLKKLVKSKSDQDFIKQIENKKKNSLPGLISKESKKKLHSLIL